MDRNTQAMRIARWKSNRLKERVSIAIAILIFMAACYPYNLANPTLIQAIAVCLSVVFFGLTVFFHDRTSRCPVCNERFADSEEYGFGDTPSLSLSDIVSHCPFCKAELDSDK